MKDKSHSLTCDTCNGQLTFVGAVGATQHYRCLSCGKDIKFTPEDQKDIRD